MNRRLSLAIAVTALILLTGCGSIGESIAERAVEEGLEAGGGGEDVQIDFDDDNGGISIETTEGSMQFGNAEVPEDFPAEIPLPDNVEVVSAMSFTEESGATFNLTMTVAEASNELAAALESRLTDAGFEITGTFEQDMDGQKTRSMQFAGPTWSGNLIVASTAGDTTVSYTVVPTTE